MTDVLSMVLGNQAQELQNQGMEINNQLGIQQLQQNQQNQQNLGLQQTTLAAMSQAANTPTTPPPLNSYGTSQPQQQTQPKAQPNGGTSPQQPQQAPQLQQASVLEKAASDPTLQKSYPQGVVSLLEQASKLKQDYWKSQYEELQAHKEAMEGVSRASSGMDSQAGLDAARIAYPEAWANNPQLPTVYQGNERVFQAIAQKAGTQLEQVKTALEMAKLKYEPARQELEIQEKQSQIAEHRAHIAQGWERLDKPEKSSEDKKQTAYDKYQDQLDKEDERYADEQRKVKNSVTSTGLPKYSDKAPKGSISDNFIVNGVRSSLGLGNEQTSETRSPRQIALDNLAQEHQERLQSLQTRAASKGIISPLKQAPAPVKGQPETSKGSPAVGSVVKGYRFKGGNPADQSSWEKV